MYLILQSLLVNYTRTFLFSVYFGSGAVEGRKTKGKLLLLLCFMYGPATG
nr:hypothetical protein Q903MT_gene662 [Picea sitchensis]